MDRELKGYRTIYKKYVIDDGWNLPKEIVEAIDLKVELARQEAYKQICYENRMHQGGWLTAEVARKYAAKSWIYRVLSCGQYVGMVRKIGQELQREYGVSELEAINILNERNVADYVHKYYCMQHKIPNTVDEQEICDDIAYEYLDSREEAI